MRSVQVLNACSGGHATSNESGWIGSMASWVVIGRGSVVFSAMSRKRAAASPQTCSR